MNGSRSTDEPQVWPVVSDELLGRYSIFTLRQRLQRSPSSGGEHHYLVLEADDWINVIPVTTTGELILIRQYRPGTNQVTVEIPGGAVDPGEQPAVAAARELAEETGYRAAALHLIGVVEPNPAFLNNRCWTYLALGCTPDGKGEPDPGEEIVVDLVPPAAFTELINNGTIRHALVIAAHDHLQRGRAANRPWATGLPW